ncbi:MAG: hypothetical protein ACKV19_01350 [Verrucomicrobiales bacterium]
MRILFLALSVSALLQAGASAIPQPDFTLTDINPGSVRSQQSISPRNYRGLISAWYFGREW